MFYDLLCIIYIGDVRANVKTLKHNGDVYSANLYHWRQTYPHRGEWGFYLCASVFNESTKAPKVIKRVSVIMGNHPNYFPG